MNDDRVTDLTNQVQTIIDNVANDAPERASQLLTALMHEYGDRIVAAALIDLSSDTISALRARAAESVAPIELRDSSI